MEGTLNLNNVVTISLNIRLLTFQFLNFWEGVKRCKPCNSLSRYPECIILDTDEYRDTQVVIPIYLLCYNQRNKTWKCKQYRMSPTMRRYYSPLLWQGLGRSLCYGIERRLGETSYVQWTGRQQSVPQWLYCDLVWPGVVNTRLACGCGSTQTTTCGYDNNPVTTPSVVSSIEISARVSGTASCHKKIIYLKKEWKKVRTTLIVIVSKLLDIFHS